MLNETENMHLVYLDRDFNFVRVNEAYAKTCGYKPEEMIGKNHFALYPDEEVEAMFKRVRDTGVPAEFHDRPFVFPDQPERGVTYWDWTLKPVKNEAGEVEGLVLSLVETTERKKAEEVLVQTRNRLFVATEAAKIGINNYDIVANTVQWDDRIREIWGVEPDEPVTYETFIENVHPDDRAAVQAEMNKALDPEKGEFYAEYRVVNRKDKTVRWVYATGKTFFDDKYNAVRLIGTAEDEKNKNYRKKHKKLKTRCWLVGLGDNLRGRRESVLKNDSPNLSTQRVFHGFLHFPSISYKALKASNHLLYSDSISNETLGFRSSRICLKSPIVINLGLASLSIALPDSKNSPISFNCAD
jgi:PAS domain S-box-containing protein